MVDIKQNDRLPALEITIKKTDGTPLDLTNATAKFIMVDSKTRTIKVNASATIKDAANGVVEYAWAAGDTDTVGDYLGEVEITYPNSQIMTAPSSGYVSVRISEELA